MPGGGFYSFVFEYGHYTAVEDLIKAINTGLVATGDVGDNIKLTYSALMKKVSVQIKNKYQFAVFKPLSVMLGFGDEEPTIKKTTTAPYMADLTVVSSIYLYCDVVEPQVVGDVNAQLLQTVPVEGTFGKTVTKTFINTQYVPIRTKSFENVEILLRTDTGEPVPFERGKVVTTLLLYLRRCIIIRTHVTISISSKAAVCRYSEAVYGKQVTDNTVTVSEVCFEASQGQPCPP